MPPFRFLALPPELRNHIYTILFTSCTHRLHLPRSKKIDRIGPSIPSRSLIRYSFLSERRYNRHLSGLKFLCNTNILATCKLCLESIGLLYSLNKFVIPIDDSYPWKSKSMFELGLLPSDTALSFIKDLRVELRLPVLRENNEERDTSGFLAKMKALEKLEIVVHFPRREWPGDTIASRSLRPLVQAMPEALRYEAVWGLGATGRKDELGRGNWNVDDDDREVLFDAVSAILAEVEAEIGESVEGEVVDPHESSS